MRKWPKLLLMFQEKDKHGSRLKSIANFFKNLGPNSHAKVDSRSSSPADDIGPAKSSGPTATTGQRTRNGYPMSGRGRPMQLPPIFTDSMSRLSVESQSKRSPSPNGLRLSSSSSQLTTMNDQQPSETDIAESRRLYALLTTRLEELK